MLASARAREGNNPRSCVNDKALWFGVILVSYIDCGIIVHHVCAVAMKICALDWHGQESPTIRHLSSMVMISSAVIAKYSAHHQSKCEEQKRGR